MVDIAKMVSEIFSKDGLTGVIEFVLASGIDRFEYTLDNKFHLTIYKVKGIIRIDIKPVSGASEGKTSTDLK